MIAIIRPSRISGTVSAVPSKSAMQRACALALLNYGTTTIYNPGESTDDLTALDIVRSCGAIITKKEGRIVITSSGIVDPDENIYCGESGLALRMFAPILSLSSKKITITGKGSLLLRPMHIFETFFPQLSVKIKSNRGYLPVSIQGPLKPVNITVDGSESSQYITGLLFALAKAALKDITLNVTGLNSRPYVNLSLQMLKHFGYDVASKDLITFLIQPITPKHREIIYETEGDWSAAAFLLVAGAISGKVEVSGLSAASAQGDKAIVDILKTCGAEVSVENGSVKTSHPGQLKSFVFDATDCPDLFPPLVALASCCTGVSRITGVRRLLTKESDRAAALKDVFTEMGIDIRIAHDTMVVTGGKIRNTKIKSHDDHRIVMAGAIAALCADDEIMITGAEAIDKSYPRFFSHLQLLGADVSLTL